VDTIESVRCAMACFDRSGADVAYFVVACRDGIAVIDDDGSVSEPYHEYCAVGLGGPIALGALGAMAHVPPIERIHSAISLCETHNSTVRGPWDVLQVEMD
jgi:ATP-dependent protease HslVU (ClpYQ) peptidase subunit